MGVDDRDLPPWRSAWPVAVVRCAHCAPELAELRALLAERDRTIVLQADEIAALRRQNADLAAQVTIQVAVARLLDLFLSCTKS